MRHFERFGNISNNFKKSEKTHGEVLLLVKLQAKNLQLY